jgi:Ulp1 family protease
MGFLAFLKGNNKPILFTKRILQKQFVGACDSKEKQKQKLFEMDRKTAVKTKLGTKPIAGINLLVSSFQTLRPGHMVDDTTIDYLLGMITEVKQTPVVFMSSLFYTQLTTKKNENEKNSDYHFEDVADQFRAQSPLPLLLTPLVIIPINQHQNHWVIVVIDPICKIFYQYDSQNSGNKLHKKIFHKIKKWIRDQSQQDSIKSLNVWPPIKNFDEWKIVCQQKTPQQTNSFDCGVFVVRIVEDIVLLKNHPLSFSPKEMDKIRDRYATNILRGHFFLN